MMKLAAMARLPLVLAMVFATGVLVGQRATPAKVQTATVEERAAAIEAELVDSITRYHATLPKDMLDLVAVNNTSPIVLWARGTYIGGLVMAAKDAGDKL